MYKDYKKKGSETEMVNWNKGTRLAGNAIDRVELATNQPFYVRVTNIKNNTNNANLKQFSKQNNLYSDLRSRNVLYKLNENGNEEDNAQMDGIRFNLGTNSAELTRPPYDQINNNDDTGYSVLLPYEIENDLFYPEIRKTTTKDVSHIDLTVEYNAIPLSTKGPMGVAQCQQEASSLNAILPSNTLSEDRPFCLVDYTDFDKSMVLSPNGPAQKHSLKVDMEFVENEKINTTAISNDLTNIKNKVNNNTEEISLVKNDFILSQKQIVKCDKTILKYKNNGNKDTSVELATDCRMENPSVRRRLKNDGEQRVIELDQLMSNSINNNPIIRTNIEAICDSKYDKLKSDNNTTQNLLIASMVPNLCCCLGWTAYLAKKGYDKYVDNKAKKEPKIEIKKATDESGIAIQVEGNIR